MTWDLCAGAARSLISSPLTIPGYSFHHLRKTVDCIPVSGDCALLYKQYSGHMISLGQRHNQHLLGHTVLKPELLRKRPINWCLLSRLLLGLRVKTVHPGFINIDAPQEHPPLNLTRMVRHQLIRAAFCSLSHHVQTLLRLSFSCRMVRMNHDGIQMAFSSCVTVTHASSFTITFTAAMLSLVGPSAMPEFRKPLKHGGF